MIDHGNGLATLYGHCSKLLAKAATTYERFQVVIYTEWEHRYAHDPGNRCKHYYGYVRDNEQEWSETIGPFFSVREAKKETLALFNSFMERFVAMESATQKHNMKMGGI